MNAIAIIAGIGFGLAVGFVLGHAFAVWSRRRFIHSLMPANGEHTDFDEDDCTDDSFGVGRARVRRGVRVGGLHTQSSTYPEAHDHVR